MFTELENCGNLPAKALSEKGVVRQSVDGLTKETPLLLPPGGRAGLGVPVDSFLQHQQLSA